MLIKLTIFATLELTYKIIKYMNSLLVFFKKLTMWKKIAIFISPIITLLVSMKLLILGLFLLIFIDLVTGIAKNLYLRGISLNPFKAAFWGAIKSYLIRNTWRKTYEYGIGIVVLATLEMLVLGSTPITFLAKTFSLTELAIVIPSIIEVWSIFENLEEISGKNMLKRLSEFMPKIVRTIVGDKTTK